MSSQSRKRAQPGPQNVKVVVRIKPTLNQEEEQKPLLKVQTHRDLYLRDKKYCFDKVFKPTCTQLELYTNIVAPLINDVVTGYNCTVFAYGQTGSGKTYTMSGEKCHLGTSWRKDDDAGIIPRTAFHLFDELNNLRHLDINVKVSFIELYNEEIRDLLNDEDSVLNLFTDVKGGLLIQGLSEYSVYDSESICQLLRKGILKRQTASTLMNHQSSRSHTCFTISVTTRESRLTGEDVLKVGKINLVDLAGSENIAKSGCKDLRAQELANINKSLLTLGRVIQALTDKSPKHIPYRDSKLTRILQDSLGGHTKTVIIATINSLPSCIDETANTLDYASRARDIKNNPIINEKYTKDQMIEGLMSEIERLQKDLDAARTGTGFYVNKDNFQQMLDAIRAITGEELSAEELEQKKTERIQELKQIIKLKLQQFENTVNECNKNKQELERAMNTIKAQKASLMEEKFVSKHFETDYIEKVAVTQKLLKTTNILSSEKELLLAKLEKLFTINAKNENLTENAVQSLLKDLNTFRQEGKNQFDLRKQNEATLKEYIQKERVNLGKFLVDIKYAFETNFDEEFFQNFSVQKCIKPVIKKHATSIEEKIKVIKKVIEFSKDKTKAFHEFLPSMAQYQKTIVNDIFSKASELVDPKSRNDHSVKTLEVLSAQEHQLMVTSATLNNMKNNINSLIEENNKALNSVRAHIHDCRGFEKKAETDAQRKMNELESLVSDSVQKFENETCDLMQRLNLLSNDISTDEVDTTSQLVKNFIKQLYIVSSDLDQSHKQFSQDLIEQVSKPVIKNCVEIEQALDAIVSHLVTNISGMMDKTEYYINIFEKFVSSTEDTLKHEILERSIKAQHVGDTPSRQSLDYPERIIEIGPRDALIQKFRQNLETFNGTGSDIEED